MRILVVDDSADTARMMKLLLKADGHEVKVAHDGAEAIEAAGSFLPEVVLLDLTLPGMSGLEVAEELRKAKEFEGTAIVAVSGYEPDKLPSAFDGHFVKPVDHDELARFLARLASGDAAPRTSLRPFAIAV